MIHAVCISLCDFENHWHCYLSILGQRSDHQADSKCLRTSKRLCIPEKLNKPKCEIQPMFLPELDLGCSLWYHHAVFVCPPSRPAPISTYRSADKSLAQPTSRCILFDGENISYDASLFVCVYIYIYIYIYIYSTNIPPNMIINRKYEHQNLLSL